jgi:hypothetical protein
MIHKFRKWIAEYLFVGIMIAFAVMFLTFIRTFLFGIDTLLERYTLAISAISFIVLYWIWRRKNNN